jgi:hypothetical protein
LSDGKSRVALAIIDVFLRMNELALAAEEPVAVKTIRLLAAGKLIDEQLSEWIEANSAEQGWRSLAAPGLARWHDDALALRVRAEAVSSSTDRQAVVVAGPPRPQQEYYFVAGSGRERTSGFEAVPWHLAASGR